MAEKVEILEIETGNSEQTLRELKDQIKDLRRELDGCTIGSDKFKDTLDELTAAQDKLKKATKGSTDTNEALEGSYDALTKKMAELKKAWRATADEAERHSIGEEIAKINAQLKDMDAEIGNYQRNVGNYASAFDDLTISMDGGVAKFERLTKVTEDAVGSFDLVEGGLKAVGVESEAASELFDKLGGVMKMTQGFKSIKEGVDTVKSLTVATEGQTIAQRLLNTVMNANPVILLISAITALTAATVGFISASNKAKQAEQEFREEVEKSNEELKKREADFAHEIRMAELNGQTRLQSLYKTNQFYVDERERALKEYEKWKNEISNVSSFRMALPDFLDNTSQMFEYYVAERDKALEKFKEYNNKIKQTNRDIEYELQVQRNNRQAEQERLAKEEADALARAAEKEAEALRKKREEHERYVAQVESLYQSLSKELDQYNLSSEELRKANTFDWYIEAKQKLDDAFVEGIIDKEKYDAELVRLEEIYADKIETIDAELLKKQRGEFDLLTKSFADTRYNTYQQQSQLIEQEYQDDLAKLKELKDAGAITESEYNDALKGIEDKRNAAYDSIKAKYVELQNSIANAQKSSSEIQLGLIEEQYNTELKMLDEMLAAKLISQEEYASAVEGITLKKQLAEEELQKTLAREGDLYGALGFKIRDTGILAEESQENIAAGVNLVSSAFGQCSQLLTTLANTQDKTSKEGFETSKKLSIAAATMQMLQGIISSWTSAMSLPAPLSFITGGIMSAFTATMGGIQIDQIKKQTFQNAGKSTSNTSSQMPSINTAALMSTPVSYTTEVKGAQTEEMIPQKVYVVESDITSTQNKVKTVEEESTF